MAAVLDGGHPVGLITLEECGTTEANATRTVAASLTVFGADPQMPLHTM